MRAVLRILTALVPLAALAALADEPAGRKYALLVGVKDYRGTSLGSLKYTENDVAKLAELLRPEYRRVVLMTRSEGFDKKDETLFPNAAAIRTQLDSLFEDRKSSDTVLVAFSGHGLVLRKQKVELFFCPEKADVDKPETLISLDEVYKRLQACPAGVKVLIADACRNDPFEGRLVTVPNVVSVTRPLVPPPPKGVAAMFSCSTGQKSFESDKLQHGVFFHHLLEGLRGRAVNKSGGIDLLKLASHVADEVPDAVKEEFGTSARQTPEPKLSVEGTVTLLRKAERPELAAAAPSVVAPNRPSAPTPAGALTLDLGGERIVCAPIPAGSFTMGSTDGEDDEKPPHTVRISKAFWMGTTEVTVGQWKRFVADANYTSEPERDGQGGYGLKADGSNWEGCKPQYNWKNAGYPITDQHPVGNVTWNDAVAFCEWASKKTSRKVVLPSEAEWEYSCRAGSTTKFHFGDDAEQLARYGNVADALAKRKFPGWTTISADDGYATTAPVGKFAKNAWGLFDMHGNVWEWCRDGKRKYDGNAVTDPEGDSAGGSRVGRGGSFSFEPRSCRAAYRNVGDASYRSDNLGFRVSVVR